MIGYGSEAPESVPARRAASDHSLNGFNLESGRYVLYVSRLEPENNPDLVLRAWRRRAHRLAAGHGGRQSLSAQITLDSSSRWATSACASPGAIYGDGYWALQKHAGIFVFACEIGGVHPALIEAMAAGNAMLYLDTPENVETAGDAAIKFAKSEDDLAAKLQTLLDDPSARQQFAHLAKQRADELYRWDAVAAKYEALFQRLVK